MGLLEFLRQWQGGRLEGGIGLSVLLHLLLLAAILWGPPQFQKASVKRGEPLIVELPQAPDSPPPGRPAAPSAPAPSPPTPARPPAPRPAPAAPPKVAEAPKPAPRPPAPRVDAPRPEAPRPEPRAPQPAPERQVASTPVPTAPDGALPAPKAAEPTPPPPPAAQEAAQPAAPPAPAAPAAPPTPAPRVAPPQVAAVPPSAPSRPVPDIRSLKGGRGGAGGSGEGRAGIEGEPIPLDSADPRYSDYLDQVRRRIKDKWGYPCVKNDSTHECEYKTAQLVIEFGIAKNGNVPFITVVRSSGYPIYDDYAVNAVKLANFPPIPDSFSKTGVPILATFSYVVQSSLTNILR